jgi:hypothetical protein
MAFQMIRSLVASRSASSTFQRAPAALYCVL